MRGTVEQGDDGKDGGCGDGVEEAGMVCACRGRYWLQDGMLLVRV